MQITITLDLDDSQVRQLLQNSIERVMNNAIYVGGMAEKKARSDSDLGDRASTLWQDCEELKPLVVKLWDRVGDQIRRDMYAAQQKK